MFLLITYMYILYIPMKIYYYMYYFYLEKNEL